MRVKLFCSPGIAEENFSYLTELPYGLGVLASFLRQKGVVVDLQDLDVELRSQVSCFNQKKIIRELFRYSYAQLQAGHYTGISDTSNNLLADDLLSLNNAKGYDLIGISIGSGPQILTSLLLAEKIKKEYNIPIVIGGPYVTAFAHLFFEKYRFIDYAIVGQGEVPLLNLIEHMQGEIPIDKVPSLWHRGQNKPMFNGRTFYDVEDQSCPDFDGLSLELYRSEIRAREKVLLIPYSTSKGCLGQCTFCVFPRVDGPWQCKSVKKVVDDIVFLKQKYKSSFFSFKDSNLNISSDHISKLCNELIRRKAGIQWNAFVKGKNLNQDLLFKMKKAGCYNLIWGLESGSDRILKMMKKDARAKESAKLLKMAKNAGISNSVCLIIGYPYETSQDLELTATLIKNNAKFIENLYILILKIIHSSFLYNNQKELKIKVREDSISPFFFWYSYKETKEFVTKRQSRAIIKSRNKIIGYSIRYVRYKYFKFPFNVILKSLGMIFARKLFILLQSVQVKRFQFRYKNNRIDSVFKK